MCCEGWCCRSVLFFVVQHQKHLLLLGFFVSSDVAMSFVQAFARGRQEDAVLHSTSRCVGRYQRAVLHGTSRLCHGCRRMCLLQDWGWLWCGYVLLNAMQ